MVTHDASGEAQRLEPEKCAGWQWFAPEALPAPLFAPLQSIITRDGLAALQALAQPAGQ